MSTSENSLVSSLDIGENSKETMVDETNTRQASKLKTKLSMNSHLLLSPLDKPSNSKKMG
jgi:hypothetical protein